MPPGPCPDLPTCSFNWASREDSASLNSCSVTLPSPSPSSELNNSLADVVPLVEDAVAP